MQGSLPLQACVCGQRKTAALVFRPESIPLLPYLKTTGSRTQYRGCTHNGKRDLLKPSTALSNWQSTLNGITTNRLHLHKIYRDYIRFESNHLPWKRNSNCWIPTLVKLHLYHRERLGITHILV